VLEIGVHLNKAFKENLLFEFVSEVTPSFVLSSEKSRFTTLPLGMTFQSEFIVYSFVVIFTLKGTMLGLNDISFVSSTHPLP
jgi:hypothetical protein